MYVKPLEWFCLDELHRKASLECLKMSDGELHLAGWLMGEQKHTTVLVIESTQQSREWHLEGSGEVWGFSGSIPANELGEQILLSLREGNLQLPWVTLKVIRATQQELDHWQAFFVGSEADLPGPDLERICHCALLGCAVKESSDRPAALANFCDRAASKELVVEAAQLRDQGRFPSVLGKEPGRILASRLVMHLNLLLVQEGEQRFVVFQGVSSSDGVLLPGLNMLLLVCHLGEDTVRSCLRILCRTPEFFTPLHAARFGGYLVGHSRPYHCMYEGLLALEAVREANELQAGDSLFSKEGEAFVDLGSCLELSQPHQQLNQEALNELTSKNGIYLLQLGFWFRSVIRDPALQTLAGTVDRQLRIAAQRDSQLASIGALAALERCSPLIWVGITSQKRIWIEQVEGIAALLNALHSSHPQLGIIFDGWTPPLTSSRYHRRETRSDDQVIRRIIKRLDFKTKRRIGIIAGLHLLEKVRVGLSVDAYVANFTTGSLNVSRICAKPGVGHMSSRMAASHPEHIHIHHHTRTIAPELVQDVSDTNARNGYVNYSVPWEALYNQLTEILNEKRPKSENPPPP